MKFSFAQVAPFAAKWRKLGLTDEDLQALETELSSNHAAGKVLRGTGGLRKIRFAPSSWHRGKSGATRVCYIVFHAISTTYLLALFAKNEQDNLSATEMTTMKKWIGEMKDALEQEEQQP